MEEGNKTPKEQSPVKNCPPAPKKKSNYVVINGNTGQKYSPMCLGTFMGALEGYYRGMELDEEQKECLINNGFKI